MRGEEEEAGSQKPCNLEDASHLHNESSASLIVRMSLGGGVWQHNL